MRSNTIAARYGICGRHGLPKIPQPRSPAAILPTRRRNRMAFVVALLSLLCCAAAQPSTAENLECPEIGPGRVPDLIGDTSGGGLFATENRIDLTNEINDAINRLQISGPNISWSDVQNVLIAAYCRVLSRKAGLSAADRWSRMRQFVSVVEQQIAADRLAPGTLLIANVPLPPDVFRELRSQAAASGQTASQLMAAILTRAAGK
jgi:hypothetical protein